MSRGLTLRKLPIRLHLKHGAYYYVYQNKWTRLSTDYAEALRLYAGYMAPQTGRMPDLLDRYLASLKVAPKTLKTYTVCVSRLKVAFRDFRPDQVKPKHFYQYITEKKVTPSMAAHFRSVMVKAMQLALKEGLIDRNLMSEVEHFQGQKRTRYLSDDEFRLIREKATPTLKAIMDMAYLTGQRIGDILTLPYSRISDDGITFIQQKTKAALMVEWNPELRQAVADAKALHQSVKGLTLFHTRQGKPFAYWTVRTLWNRACEAAGVQDAHMHDIRAKAATDAKKAGLDSKGLLGHKSEQTHARYIRDKEVPRVKGLSKR